MSDNRNIPNNYFDNLPKRIIESVEGLDDDLTSNAPILSKIGNDLGFKVPKDYFEKLAPSLKEKKINHPRRRIIPLRWTSIAAAVSLVLASIFVVSNYNNSSNNPDLANFIAEDVLDYYLQEPFEIDDNLLLELESDLSEDYISYIDDIDDSELDYYLELIIDDIPEEDIEYLFK